MPRPVRPDLHPTIWIPDTADAQRRAREAVGSRYNVSVYEPNRTVPYIRWFAALDSWIRFLRSEGETIDHEVLHCMVGHLRFADARSHGRANEDGFVPHILYVPGCRIERTQQEIADELGCSVERVRLAMKKLRLCGIIVNSGKGWYEFDAGYVWKGGEDIRLAYAPVQAELTRIEIFDSRIDHDRIISS